MLMTGVILLLAVQVTCLTSGHFELLDMGYDLASDTLVWPSGRKFEITKTYQGENAEGIWVTVQDFCSPEHGGTHLDAPYHFVKGRWTVDQIPTDRLLGAAVRVDISGRAKEDPDAQLMVDDLQKWEQKHGKIPNGSVVFMYSGWGRFWGNETAYFGNGDKDTSKFHYPGFHPSAAQWLAVNRSISGIGVDTASLDHGPSRDWLTHKVTGEANIYGLENVANVDQLPADGARVIVLPMKIRGGTGSPCRIIAEFQKGTAEAMTNEASQWTMASWTVAMVVAVVIDRIGQD